MYSCNQCVGLMALDTASACGQAMMQPLWQCMALTSALCALRCMVHINQHPFTCAGGAIWYAHKQAVLLCLQAAMTRFPVKCFRV